MSNDFRKVLVKDDRLMVTDVLNYAVKKGGQSIVSQVAQAIASSSSVVNFNVQIPSEQTIVDRRVFTKNTVLIQFQTGGGAQPFVYGQNIALAAFPFHQLCSTVQATLNNNVTSINIRDVLPFLIRSNDSRELSKSCSSCPTKPDSFYYSSDSGGVNSLNGQVPVSVGSNPSNLVLLPANPSSQFGGIDTVSDTDLPNNGTFAGIGAAGTTINTSLDGPVRLYWATSAAGPWTLQTPNVNSNTGPTAANFWQLQFTTIEPVLCQPFLWSDPVSNKQGIYGLQTVQLQYNIANATRCFRLSDSVYTSPIAHNNVSIVGTPSVVSVTNSTLIFKYITPHPSDLLPARNVIPLLTYDRYFSNATNPAIPANYGTPVTINSNTYNLTQVPDKICVFLRKKMSTQDPTDNDVVPVITNISINWNNNAGLLSSATLQDLYYYSVEAGSNQSFSEFCGQANVSQSYFNAGGYAGIVPTIGSYLMLDFATVIQLTEDFYAPGSLGNFQLQFQVQVQSLVAVAASTLELVCIVMNSGIMVTDRGQTSTYTGILTKNDVLEASQQEPFSIMDVKRQVGSGHCDSGRALPRHMFKGRRGHSTTEVKPAVEQQSKMNSRLM
jgi:hypothetical protein